MDTDIDNPEIGKPLTAAELKVGELVVIQPPGQEAFFTMWVRELANSMVLFYAGDLHWLVVNFISDKGEIVDDRGRVVKVYEYLGDP